MKYLGLLAAASACAAFAADQPVSVQFKAVVGTEELACGHSYSGIGTTKSTITPRDFRFYVSDVRALELTLEYDPQPPFHTGSPETAPPKILAQMQQMYAPLSAAAKAAAKVRARSQEVEQ